MVTDTAEGQELTGSKVFRVDLDRLKEIAAKLFLSERGEWSNPKVISRALDALEREIKADPK